jgi:hypothetical protein
MDHDTNGEGTHHTFPRELESLINRFSQENESNTPDYILAQYLLTCLSAWNRGVQQRETWYGRDARPAATTGAAPLPPVPAADKEPPHPRE